MTPSTAQATGRFAARLTERWQIVDMHCDETTAGILVRSRRRPLWFYGCNGCQAETIDRQAAAAHSQDATYRRASGRRDVNGQAIQDVTQCPSRPVAGRKPSRR